MILLLPTTLVSLLSSCALLVSAQSCNTANNQLTKGNFQLKTDCSPTQFCDGSGQCKPKGCTRDEFPFGYGKEQSSIPPRCQKGQFCPDEGDACQDLLPPGSPCQLNRDDQCAPPDNHKELAGDITQNFNGSICLISRCMFANITVGQQCVLDNTPYTVYMQNGSEFIDVVSRSDCRKDLYCDATAQPPVCKQKLNMGDTCAADKECTTNNCLNTLKCGPAPDAPKHFSTWVYIVVAIAILGGMVGTLVALWFIHSRHRAQTVEKRMQYWREQNAFRQNIMQMRETARSSMLSYPRDGTSSNRSSRIGLNTEDSQIPMLSTRGNPSGLRNQYTDEDHDDVYAAGNGQGQVQRGMSYGKSTEHRI